MGTHPIFESDFDCLTEMDRRCCYQGRLCNSKVVEHDGRVTGFCSLHILNSRFAAELGYKQCHFTNEKRKNKKCHRPVRQTTKHKIGENIFCGRHQKREKIERDPLDETNNKHRRVEDSYNDIPDSDPDSDSLDHPLENSSILTEKEINEILAVKVEKLENLYLKELKNVNNDLIEEERQSKNIHFHFFEQSKVGNELIVAQMAKAKQNEIYFKIKQQQQNRSSSSNQSKCKSEQDCWKHSLRGLEFCLEHAKEQKNQFLYGKDIIEESQPTVSLEKK